MSQKARIKSLEKMVKALRADVNKLKLASPKSRNAKPPGTGASVSPSAKLDKSAAPPIKQDTPSVRISAQR